MLNHARCHMKPYILNLYLLRFGNLKHFSVSIWPTFFSSVCCTVGVILFSPRWFIVECIDSVAIPFLIYIQIRCRLQMRPNNGSIHIENWSQPTAETIRGLVHSQCGWNRFSIDEQYSYSWLVAFYSERQHRDDGVAWSEALKLYGWCDISMHHAECDMF